MDVRIIVGMGYGARDGRHWKLGEIADLPDELAEKLIRNRIAEAVKQPEPETMAVSPSENMAKRTSPPKPRKAVN